MSYIDLMLLTTLYVSTFLVYLKNVSDSFKRVVMFFVSVCRWGCSGPQNAASAFELLVLTGSYKPSWLSFPPI